MWENIGAHERSVSIDLEHIFNQCVFVSASAKIVILFYIRFWERSDVT